MLILVRIADFFSSFQHTQTLESNEETAVSVSNLQLFYYKWL